MPSHGRSPIERLSTSYTPYFLLRFLHGLVPGRNGSRQRCRPYPGYHKHTPDSVSPQMWQHVRSESDLKEFRPTVRARFERARSDSSINVPELTKGSQRLGTAAAHQSDARLPGTGQLPESGGNQSWLLCESEVDASPLVGGDLVYLIHQFDAGGRGQQAPGQRQRDPGIAKAHKHRPYAADPGRASLPGGRANTTSIPRRGFLALLPRRGFGGLVAWTWCGWPPRRPASTWRLRSSKPHSFRRRGKRAPFDRVWRE